MLAQERVERERAREDLRSISCLTTVLGCAFGGAEGMRSYQEMTSQLRTAAGLPTETKSTHEESGVSHLQDRLQRRRTRPAASGEPQVDQDQLTRVLQARGIPTR